MTLLKSQVIQLERQVGTNPGGTLKFCIYIGVADLFWFKILNFKVFWAVQKNEYFWGHVEDFCGHFSGVTTKVNVENWNTCIHLIFLKGRRVCVCVLTFQVFLGVYLIHLIW